MACSDPRFTFRFLSADEIESFAEEPSYFIDPSLVDGVRDGREVCFAALEGDRLAAFGCYTLGFVPPEQCGRRGHVVSGRRGLHVVRLHASRFPRRSAARLHHGPRFKSWRNAASRNWFDRRLDELGVTQKLLAAVTSTSAT